MDNYENNRFTDPDFFDEVVDEIMRRAEMTRNRVTNYEVDNACGSDYCSGYHEFREKVVNEIRNRGVTVYEPEDGLFDKEEMKAEEESLDIDSFRLYLRDVGRYELLTPEEEKSLSDRARNGDEAAKNKLICSNLRLVISFAKRYLNSGLDLPDLVQEGTIGLMKAVEKFDPSMGCRFSTYATWWIRQSVSRAISDNARIIRVPVHMTELVKKYKRVSSEFALENNREATDEEIMELLNVSKSKLQEIYTSLFDVCSLDVPVGDEDEDTIGSFVASGEKTPEDIITEEAHSKEIMRVINSLPPREAEIIKMRMGFFGKPYTLTQVGDILGITRERVRQVEVRALRKLRQPHITEILMDAS